MSTKRFKPEQIVNRLRQIEVEIANGKTTLQACRDTEITTQTYYRWKRRYDPADWKSLEDGSHRPHRRRQPTWSAPLAERVLALRRQFPSAPSKWMAAVSSPPSLNKLASNPPVGGLARPAAALAPTQWPRRTRQPHPRGGVR